MILLIKDNYFEEVVGSKAARLKELVNKSYNVPEFVVIPTDVTTLILKEEKNGIESLLNNAREEILKALPGQTYAVRSAALVEDGKNNSYAGQFKTVLAVTKDNLSESIMSVIKDAEEKLEEDFKFSVIIQDYISPDFAGVIFSRNPVGGREMVIEYNQGPGESVVSGEKVQQTKFIFGKENGQKDMPSFARELSSLARSIENEYDFPQDIEWAVKEGVIYILQTRPITSISDDQWKGIKVLDETLETEEDCFYEQTSLSETFDKPRPLAFSILKSLYQAGGPVEKVYKKFGLSYSPTEQIRLFGNELYVDKQAEIKSIFPAFGYLKHSSNKPKLENYSGVFTSFVNWFKLSRISIKSSAALQENLETLLQNKFSEQGSLKDWWSFVSKQYEIIFEINIKSQKALKTFERVLGKDVQIMTSLLSLSAVKKPSNFTHDGLVGNSFNIDDTTTFVSSTNSELEESDKKRVEKWLAKQPRWRWLGLQPYLKQAQLYIQMREQARLLSVKLACHLRTQINKKGDELFEGDTDLIYFSTVDELLSDSVSNEKCNERKAKYLDQENILLPKVISSFLIELSDKENTGLSAGVASGTLVNEENLNEGEGPKILYTKILSPNLFKYFDQVEGIVSEEGGLLSHLAIVARESKLPVVVTKKRLKLNSTIKINGSSGAIE